MKSALLIVINMIVMSQLKLKEMLKSYTFQELKLTLTPIGILLTIIPYFLKNGIQFFQTSCAMF